jgi:hypothetical protein
MGVSHSNNGIGLDDVFPRAQTSRDSGSVYIRDPNSMVGADQLNGGELTEFTETDWQLIKPYLVENERLFGIEMEKDLLTVDGHRRPSEKVYRKVQPVKLAVLSKVEEAWE